MKKKKRLGEILLDEGVITPKQLADVLEDQKRYGGKLGNILLERRIISEKDFFMALTSQLGIPAVDFSKSTIPETVIKSITQELAEKYTIFPVALKRTPQGTFLVLAMADPTNVEIQDEVRFTTGYKVEPALSLEGTIEYVIRDYFSHQEGKGSYRLEADLEGSQAPGQETFYQNENQGQADPDRGQMQITHEERADRSVESPDDKPQLTRELKALLKLLAQKGIISPKEYREVFKETK